MEDTRPTKPTFLCSICGNESTSASSLKRHVRYCRRKGPSSRSRTKSCQSCIRAKARCEPLALGCLRCAGRGLACSLLSSTNNHHATSANSVVASSGAQNKMQSQEIDDLFQAGPQLDSPLAMMDGVFPFNLSMPPIPLIPSNDQPRIALEDGDALNSTYLSTPAIESLYSAGEEGLKLFELRPFHTPSTIMASTMGIGILRSYPLMMRSRNTFPPFIHPCCYGSQEDEWTLPIALSQAVSIAASYAIQSSETVSSVRKEQQRIDSNLMEMGIEDLLSSGQTLIIYILMRVESGPSELDEDVHLYATLSRLCFRILSLPGFYERMAEFSPWKRWVLVESKRRLNSTLRLILQLYKIDVAPSPCLSLFTAMPLPASKLLWQATSEKQWEEELAKDDFYKKLSFQDLMNFKGASDHDQPSREEWSRWYSGADELGILVVISTSLL